MLETVKQEWEAKLLIVLFTFLTAWCIFLNLTGLKNPSDNYLFGASYGVIALVGGILGMHISREWGFPRSIMGKSIFFLSLGLLTQEFGQLVFSYYNIFLHVEVPYPSLADLGFFGTIPLYILGVFYLIKASGAQFTMEKVSGKLQVILVPLVMLAVSYFFFLQGHDWNDATPLQIFLDLGYPLGQSIFVSMALLVYTLSKNFLGGIMRTKILILLLALIAQYIADFNFLYQNSRGTWENAGYGDYLYLVAYFLMAMGILALQTVVKNLKHQP